MWWNTERGRPALVGAALAFVVVVLAACGPKRLDDWDPGLYYDETIGVELREGVMHHRALADDRHEIAVKISHGLRHDPEGAPAERIEKYITIKSARVAEAHGYRAFSIGLFRPRYYGRTADAKAIVTLYRQPDITIDGKAAIKVEEVLARYKDYKILKRE